MEWLTIEEFLTKPIEPTLNLSRQIVPKLIEIKEPLVKVRMEANRLFVNPIYYIQKIPFSIQTIYLREGVYNRLKRALESLPSEYSFVLYDGFRPLQVQQSLFDKFSEDCKSGNPHFSREQVLQETLKYVAYPSVDPNRTSPHITGGAIDLTLGDSDGNVLDLGSEFDEMSEKSATRFFENHPEANHTALQNRRILYNCMTNAGFNNYAEEWWHYDYGNVSWARRIESETVLYGPVIAELENNDVKEYRFL